MKKYVITGVLCFIVGISFGQKKAVNAAKNEIKGNTPNIAEARTLIKGALVDPETANDAETWYVAGKIENKQFEVEQTKEILGRQPNEEVMFSALERILPYFIKAAELDQLPDAKGKVKPRFLKDIRSIVRANRPFYINAGAYAYDNKDYRKAYENFKLFGDIPSLGMYDGEKWIIAKGDTTELQYKFYAAMTASFIPDYKAAIAIYEEIKGYEYVENNIYTENELYQRLVSVYAQAEDSVALENILKEGFLKFPNDDTYVLSLINLYLSSGKSGEVVSYLDKAIALNPNNAQLYDVLGQIYEIDNKPDEALLNMKKALDMDPENIEYLSHLGRVYFNLGVEKRGESDEISDLNKSKQVFNQSQDYFKQSMPFFEKVFELDAKNREAIYALRSIYYSLGMIAQSDKMDALLNTDNE